MLTKDCNFRDIYHKVCFIECADQIQNLKKVFNVSKKDNGVLAYGYIDHEDGFTFEVLTTGKLENGVLSTRFLLMMNVSVISNTIIFFYLH